ncbi:hypothetical protein [Thiothrix unzii]|jgi:hypothetical protein|uniref:hypothetical protein n=1 Tax=Thiothrix unzii TaxID=111769 RepID=UPI002A369D95|nr:hypothetical protein [Thiothrix unzii]MDX9990184.1 hypothetical protein [Thiothrix unzii]
MSFWSSAWDVIKSVGGSVAKVVKKTYEVLTNDKTVEVYDKIEKIIEKTRSPAPIYETYGNTSSPDFFGALTNSNIDKKLDEHNKKLNQYQEESVQSRKLTVLQMELSRLRGSAELIDRSIKNVKIHASSLSVHYQNIRNINGLIEDVNTLRYGLKAVISTINHNSKNLGGEENGFKKIEGVDINKKQGAISQVAAFDAFDRTRELLKDEVFELSLLSTKHLKDVERLKIHAANVGGDIGRQVIDCIDRDVIPVFKNAESAGLLLKSEVSRLPVAARDDAGMLKFDNGKIMIESDSLG